MKKIALLFAFVSLICLSFKSNAQITVPGTTDVIQAGGRIGVNERVYSSNRQYFLTYQDDSNLCLYKVGMSQALWSSGSVHSAPMYALFDQYMNIIIYAAGGEIWRTNGGAQAAIPPGPGGPYFYWVVQNDGNFVVYYNIPGFPADSKSTNTAGGVVTKHNHQIR